jgi:hypothetical protein
MVGEASAFLAPPFCYSLREFLAPPRLCIFFFLRSRLAPESLPSTDHEDGVIYSPSAFHIPATRALVASSIKISSGQGRLNPSLAHFLVASIPIFDPKSCNDVA